MAASNNPTQSEDERKPTFGSRQPSWSLRIGSVAGIPIRIHFTFWLLLVWIALAAHGLGHSVAAQVGLVACLFACVLMHELGHALTAKSFGIRTRDITLYPIGGISSLESMGKPRQELWISLAGPGVNIAIAACIWAFLALSGDPLSVAAVTTGHLDFLQW